MQFAKGIRTLTTRANAILVEVGPGRDLNALVIRHIEDKPDIKTVDLIPAQEKDISAVFFLLNRIGRLWHWGVNPDWNQFHTGENRNRVPLPTYPFERQRCWIEGNPYKFEARQWGENAPLQRKTDIADWFYIPAWKQTVPPLLLNPDDLKENRQRWLICVDDRGIGTTLAKRMQEKGHEVLQVRKGDRFSRLNHREYTINVRERADYETLIKDLISANKEPEMIVHLWSVDAEQAGEGEQPGIEVFKTRLDSGFNSLLFLIQAMAAHKLALTVIEPADIPRFIQVVVITNNAQPLPGDEKISPGQAAVLGLCRTIPLEYQNIRCRSIDLALTGTGQRQQAPLVGHLSAELLSQNTDLTTAYRENTRWVQYFEPFRPGHHQGCPRQLKERGVYLITGGLGRDSFVRAKYLAETVRARLVLVGRSKLPDRQQWDQWRHTHDDDDPINRKIKQVREIEESGGEVLLISADAANEDEMRSVMRQIDERFGQLHGVIHAAGITSIDSSVMIPGIGSKETEWHFKPKVYGLYTLEKVLMGRPLDFCLLTSSIASFFGGVGLSAYTAASIFMDIYTHWHNQISPVPWMSLNWEGSTPRETADIFHRLLNLGPIPQVLISKVDAQKRMEERFKPKIDPRESEVNQSKADTPLQRPELLSPYAAPANEIQEKLVQIWENFFGIAPLGIKDDFFELKGDSLKAVMMAAKIYKEFNVEVSLAEFFHRPTIEKLADYITAAARSECFSIQPVEKKEYSGLSSAQKRMYILQQMYPHITAYNIPLVRELDEKPDYERLERGFRQLIDRHENLRTSFMMIGGETLQKVNENWHFDIERYENIQEGEEERKTVDTFVRPFDLSRAPLFRAGVIETSRERYLLMVDQHHIVSDAVSHHILIHDFQVLEAGKKLPPLKLQYKDYSQWQNSEQGNRAMKEQETYWLRQFERDIPGLKIPTDYDRPQIINFEGNYIKFSLEKETYDKVKAFTRETGTTLYMFLFSIFNILLYKYTRQEDIVVGSTVTGRKYVDLQNIIGMFVNMMPMRCRLRPDKPFKEFLMEVKEKVLAAVENQDYQFDRLVSALGLKRDPSGNPLFNVVFNMINVDGGEAGDTNLKVLSYEYKHEATVFDLILSASEGTEMVTMALKYSTQLFKQTTIEKMIERYVDIINHVLANSEITLEDIKVSHGLLATTSSKQKYEENVFGF
jgi:acyl carrier protein/NADP-dependent 3-hydroxy acid dehydrogenase YdfG